MEHYGKSIPKATGTLSTWYESVLGPDIEHFGNIDYAKPLPKRAMSSVIFVPVPQRLRQEEAMALTISRLETHLLSSPVSVIVEPDENLFLAKTPDFPLLYGVGDDRVEAVEMLQREIESLWRDLQEEPEPLNEEWECTRRLLNKLVVPHEK